MNVGEINVGTRGSLHTFLAVAIPFTAATVWVLGAMLFHSTSSKENERTEGGADPAFLHGREPVQPPSFWHRVGWPVIMLRGFIEDIRKFRDASITRGG